MEYEKKAFFSEHEDDEVSGFVIVEVNEETETYRVAEKWNRSDKESTWITYAISEQALADRIDEGDCSYKQQLADKQFRGVLNLAEIAHQYQAAA